MTKPGTNTSAGERGHSVQRSLSGRGKGLCVRLKTRMVFLRGRLVESVQLNHVGPVLKVVFSIPRVMGIRLESQVCDSLFS